jgi:hypothetical protein
MFLSNINDYTCIKSLGRGKFGEVYLVKNPHSKEFALKIIGIYDQD